MEIFQQEPGRLFNMGMKITATYLPENIKAFLQTIQFTEGTYLKANPYAVLFGGSTFSDFSTHPNVRVPFHNPLRSTPGNNDYSTAAGAYQILKGTDDSLGGGFFDPETQDLKGVELIKRRGAYNDILNDDIETAARKLSPEWASMPYSTSGQPKKSLTKVKSVYEAAKGLKSDSITSTQLVIAEATNFAKKNALVIGGVAIALSVYVYFIIRKK